MTHRCDFSSVVFTLAPDTHKTPKGLLEPDWLEDGSLGKPGHLEDIIRAFIMCTVFYFNLL